MYKSSIILALILSFFNPVFAQLEISQESDDILIKNTSRFSSEVFVSNVNEENFILMPNQSVSISTKQFLTKKRLKQIKVYSLYTYQAYLADTKLSILKMRDDISNYRSNRRASLKWKSIEELLNRNNGENAKKLNNFIGSLGIKLDNSGIGVSKYEIFVMEMEEELIPRKNIIVNLTDDGETFPVKENESETALARSYLFDFLNFEVDYEDVSEMSYLVEHFNRVKSYKSKYLNRTVKEYGNLSELDFKVFEDFGGPIQFSLTASAFGEDIGGENEDLIYNFNPEIGIRTGRYRLGKNTMIENNLNLGYSYYTADMVDERIVINDIVNNLDEVHDKFHLATLGLDFILKGGVKKPSLFGLGVEGGGTYIISDTYNFTPDLDLSENTETDLGYYYGGFLMIGDRFNVKIGYRRYVLRYTIDIEDRNYLNTGLARFSLSYRF